MTSHLKSASGTPALKWLMKISFHLATSSGELRPEKMPPGRVAPNQNSWRTCSTLTLAPGAARITSVPMRFLAMAESRPASHRRRRHKTDFRIPMAVNLARLRFAVGQAAGRETPVPKTGHRRVRRGVPPSEMPTFQLPAERSVNTAALWRTNSPTFGASASFDDPQLADCAYPRS